MQTEFAEGFRLSRQQRHLWLLQQAVANAPYRVQCSVMIDGALDRDVLGAAIVDVWKRHEILRTSFRCLPGMSVPLQVVADDAPPTLKVYDLSDAAPADQEATLKALFDELEQWPVESEQGACWQNTLAILSPESHVLMLVLPAICADMRSAVNGSNRGTGMPSHTSRGRNSRRIDAAPPM